MQKSTIWLKKTSNLNCVRLMCVDFKQLSLFQIYGNNLSTGEIGSNQLPCHDTMDKNKEMVWFLLAFGCTHH